MGALRGALTAALVATMTVFTGCAQPASPPATTATATAAAPAPAVRTVIDPRWITVDTADGAWWVLNHEISRNRQRFDLQPDDETFVYPNECAGCNHPAWTAALTVYARGVFDPAVAMAGEPVTVGGAEGYLTPPRWPAGPVLTWRYDTNSWATVQGTTESTGDLARLLDIAVRVRVADRTAIRYPLSLATLPADVPLSGVVGGRDGPLTLSFDACGSGVFELPVIACSDVSDRLDIRWWASDEFPEHRIDGGQRKEAFTQPVQIGGRDGFLHEFRPTAEAAITVAPGVTVTFELSGPGSLQLGDVLAAVRWAPDPADKNSWPAVADWT
ncbi:hypothetical protein [Mycobacterium sp. C31M]